jgi:hypothetical protein
MRAASAALLLAQLLAGCAGPVQWEKDGATEAALEQDSKQCKEKARLAATAVLVAPPIPQPGMLGAPMRQQDQYAMRESQEFGSCMLDRGYKVKR